MKTSTPEIPESVREAVDAVITAAKGVEKWKSMSSEENLERWKDEFLSTIAAHLRPVVPVDDSEHDGWNYSGKPAEGDARKYVTLEQDGMKWVGIRAYHFQDNYWMNGNEPEAAKIIAWRDLPPPARGVWQRGKLFVPKGKKHE